jgi:hypothetical protein
MTHPFEAALNEIEAGLEGVTEGPWRARKIGDSTATYVGGVPVISPGQKHSKQPFLGVLCCLQEPADAAHIARLDPATVRELIRLARLGIEVEKGVGVVRQNRKAAIAELQRQRQETNNG